MYLGDFTTANTVYVYFNTFDSNDPSASVTLTGLALGDIQIYKDGNVVQRASTSGFTLLDTDGIDFDGTTGIHGFSVDLSDNTTAGFYAAGSEYTIVVASVTVDAATVNFVAATLSIERTGGALALLKGTNSLANIKTDTAAILVDTGTTLDGRIPAALVGGRMDADVGAISTDTTAADNLELFFDGTGYDAANSTVGTVTTNTDMVGTNNAALASVVGALNDAAVGGDPTATDTVMQYIKQLVNVLVGTAGVVTFPAAAAPGNAVSLAEIIRSIYDDSNELQGDWVDAGRLDAILDARMAEASINTTGGAVDTVTTATNLTNAATAGDLTAVMKTSVNAEVDTALVTTTYAEPAQGAPAATASIKDKIGYLYKAWRNRSNQTSTTYQLFNDDATTVDHKATVSDDATTAEKGEVATGP